jgi:hypothetical protein
MVDRPALYDTARDEARRALGALLVDGDVSSARAVEGGALDVSRRSRREVLEGTALPALFLALRALGAGEGRVEVEVDGHRLLAGPHAGGLVVAALEKAPPLDVRLEALVEEGLLPSDAAEVVLGLARAGHGLLVVGPAGAARRRLAAAVARALGDDAAVMALDPAAVAPWLLPAPLEDDVTTRALAGAAAGAELLFSSSLTLDDVRHLAAASLPLPCVAAVEVASATALYAALRDGELDALASQVCVVGRGRTGRPALLEQHAPPLAALTAPPPPAALFAPAPLVERSASRRPMDPSELPPLSPLGAGPPAGWGEVEDEGPGWELDDDGGGPAPAEPTAFDSILDEVKRRPRFSPKQPAPHPQAQRLKSDPFGGLTLEPPPGEYGEDEEGAP